MALILTAEEYARGFIDFDANLPEGCAVELWTRTFDQPGNDTGWDGPYSTPEGAKVLSQPKPYMQLRVELRRSEDPTKTPVLRKVRLERDGQTFIWSGPNDFNGPPGPLSLGRDYGVSYRVVFQPQRASWTESFVVISRAVRIRFWKGGVKGYDISGFRDAEPTPKGTLWVEGAIKESELSGDTIEVLATLPGNDDEQTREAAKSQVESVVGLLALGFGEQIVGNPIFADYYFSDASGEQGHVVVPVKHLLELSVDKNIISPIGGALEWLRNSPICASVSMSLRWYAAGLSTESLVDKFIAFFIGLEALSSGYFATMEPKPVRKE